MEPLLDSGLILIGGVMLYFGAEWLVDGASGIAEAFGIKPLVVGLTVVAFGTSAPELAVSAVAILDDGDAIVLGNIVGSCVANLCLIVGITAMIAPLAVDGRLIKREVPILIVSAAAVPLLLIGGVIGTIEAGVLVLGACAFVYFTVTKDAASLGAVSGAGAAAFPDATSSEQPAGGDDEEESPLNKAKMIGLTVFGLAVLIGGGELFVRGARGLALALGMSERVVGLTIVAIGTSLPELAASVVAALKGKSEMAIGNVVGSNVLNIFLVLGVVGLIRPIHGDLSALRLDMLFLVGATALGVLMMRGARNISRPEGVLLLTTYTAFIVLAVMGW